MRLAGGLRKPFRTLQARSRDYAGDCFRGKLWLARFSECHPDARARRRRRRGSRRGGGSRSLFGNSGLAHAFENGLELGHRADETSPARSCQRRRASPPSPQSPPFRILSSGCLARPSPKARPACIRQRPAAGTRLRPESWRRPPDSPTGTSIPPASSPASDTGHRAPVRRRESCQSQ
jgi:hypothetical protein